jgi:hypothetical protein
MVVRGYSVGLAITLQSFLILRNKGVRVTNRLYIGINQIGNKRGFIFS